MSPVLNIDTAKQKLELKSLALLSLLSFGLVNPKIINDNLGARRGHEIFSPKTFLAKTKKNCNSVHLGK